MANTLTRYTQPSTVTRLPELVDKLFRDSFVMPTFWDQAFGGTAHPSLPVNLYETPESFVFHASLPGMTPDNLDIQVVGRELTIKGKVEVNTPEGGNWIWRGIPTGEFYQAFTLPVEIQSDAVQASYDYGILSLVLPKAEHARPKSIKVNVQK
jgi:HSP20 family protein